MDTGKIDAKVTKIETDVKEAKKKVSKRKVVKAKEAEAVEGCQNLGTPETKEAKPKPKRKEPKVLTPKEWLDKYTKDGEATTSGAKLVTYLMTRPEGCDLKTLIARASEIAVLKQSSWGTSKTHIKSHINYLKGKSLKVTELKEDVFRLSV